MIYSGILIGCACEERRNALTRKGKAEDTDEGDMDVVVSIHNNMNELTWKKILEWEKIRRCDILFGGYNTFLELNFVSLLILPKLS